MKVVPEAYSNQFRRTIDSYSVVTDASFAKLLALLRCQSVPRGNFLVQTGQTARNFYFVCEGILASLLINQQGAAHIKNFFIAGNFAGSTVSLLQASPSAFGLQAIVESIILVVDYRQYKQLICENSDLTNFYIAYLERNWVINNEKRQLAFATQTATERYLTFLDDYPDLEKQVLQLHIASYLGITPTQLSRIRKGLNLI
ncbi:Crp/Fnr family transcriptional regulator [Fibrella sp. HMF5335]|uniref:Crp/Fnr family transcriptional regulator n=1 Tax=Fibrella rubiginis TaxID=2817060 RepID=A0A939GE77_9BACT|nr:Crp/Fnr family transcriptional regulator [Fibrella rubiginis]MBO0937339.1 Crp/Fnr family transcriptional regulator [Fibrella rubiginis]